MLLSDKSRRACLKHVRIEIDDELLNQARAKARRENRPLSEVIADAIRNEIQERRLSPAAAN